MRKLVLLFATFFALSSVSSDARAQYRSGNRIIPELGIRVGINVSSIEGDMDKLLPGVKLKNRTKLHAGIIFNYELAPELYLQPGLFIIRKGYDAEGYWGSGNWGSNYVSYKIENQATYIQIPVLFSVRPIFFSSISRLHFDIGPYFSYGIHGKKRITHLDYRGYSARELKEFGLERTRSFGSNGDFDRFDLGAIFGCRISFYKVSAGFQYEMGILNIANQDAWNGQTVSNRNPSYRNDNISFMLGYTF